MMSLLMISCMTSRISCSVYGGCFFLAISLVSQEKGGNGGATKQLMNKPYASWQNLMYA